MKIINITIENYRSISELSICPEEVGEKKCMTLLGVNEAGKSNILKAISLLDSGEKINYKTECNKKALDDGKDIVVTFAFELDEAEAKACKKILVGSSVPEKLIDIINIQMVKKVITMDKAGVASDWWWIYLVENGSIKKFRIETTAGIIYPIVTDSTLAASGLVNAVETLAGQVFEDLDKDS